MSENQNNLDIDISSADNELVENAGAEIVDNISITDASVKQVKQTKAMIQDKQQNIENNVEKDDVKDYNFKTKNQKAKNNLLDTLVEKGVLTRDQVKVAETQANKTGDSVIDVLIQLNFVTDSVIHQIFENRNSEKDKVNLVDIIPDMELVNKIPTSFALEHKVLPISQVGNIIKVEKEIKNELLFFVGHTIYIF